MGLIGRQEPTGAFAKLDDITSLFDGNATTFNLTLGGQDFFPGNPFTLLVSVAGVIQEPATDFTIIESAIKFTSAPANGASGFIVVLSTPSTSNVIIKEVGSGSGGGGLGIPISTTPNIPLNSIFHGADVLRITQDSTVTLPSGDSTIAFSVARDVLVEDNKDLIIDDSVDYIPDVVSLSQFI
tara:strand:+ start:213 stop:761 length:549 start_codon:yes stop_codon:yes gene_type:complete